MRPRNNEEREVCKLQSLLPAPTMEQMNWMLGQDYERLSEEFSERKKKVEHWEYFSMVSAVEDWQVVRYFIISTKMTRNGYRFNYLSEVSQRWMRIEGKEMHLHVFEKPKVMNWQWHHQPYSLSSELSLKTWNTSPYNRGGRTEFWMADYEVYPKREFAKCFVKAGLAKVCGRVDEICLYADRKSTAKEIKSLELSEEGVKELTRMSYLPPIYETLIKIGERDLANLYLSGGWFSEQIGTFWKSFLIARRHGLHITDINEWSIWFDYVRDLKRIGRDIRSPKYLVPADIRAEHGKVIRKIYEAREKLNKERAKLEEERTMKRLEREDKEYARKKGRFIGISFTTKSGIIISVAKSATDVYEEGKHMHHCVYTNGYYKKDEDLLLFARDKDGKRVETCRINLYSLKVAESRGVQNCSTEWHDEIVDALNENMWRIEEARDKAA